MGDVGQAERIADLDMRLNTLSGQTKAQQVQINMLLDQNAAIRNALQLILQGRWDGEMPHATAFVKALDPNNVNWEPVPFWPQ
jgi:hypothetical protein